jgi:hypothetical protein
MSVLLIPHIAAGSVAILSGTAAVAVRKGGTNHSLAGTCFVASMILLGLSAAVMALTLPAPDPSRASAGILAVYFAVTSWAAARWRKGMTGPFEVWACAAILSLGLTLVSFAVAASHSATGTFAAYPPTFYLTLAGLCALFAILDLNVILRPIVSGKARISRHIWRMCFAFFFATGSFFLGQQKVMPAEVRGSLILWILGLAPLAIMLFWLMRIRFPRRVRRASAIIPSLGRVLADQPGV